MIVERIWTGNAYRNYNYLIACPESGEALAIDPLDHEKCLNAARVKGWQITQILNTHEHHDHTGGNAAVVAATGAKVIAHHRAGSRIAGVDRGVKAGDVIKVGKTVELECLDTPGHTMCHICLRSHTDQPALFSGDTLFNAGAGNVHNGGSAIDLYATFVDQLAKLPEDTLVYPGHDYIENNLRFTLAREPGNAEAEKLLPEVSAGIRVVCVDDDDLVLGTIEPATLPATGPATAFDVAHPGPTSVRPSITVDELARSMDKAGETHVLITTLEGTLIGVVERGALRVDR